ncbi:hypothetical protein [Fulvimarina sp. MAC3]|uniref:hypothetical protein n=1 Tax=Fulvimarina sp. MAC3 TaxID=3148887 RepID=UPI0031FD7EA7
MTALDVITRTNKYLPGYIDLALSHIAPVTVAIMDSAPWFENHMPWFYRPIRDSMEKARAERQVRNEEAFSSAEQERYLVINQQIHDHQEYYKPRNERLVGVALYQIWKTFNICDKPQSIE